MIRSILPSAFVLAFVPAALAQTVYVEYTPSVALQNELEHRFLIDTSPTGIIRFDDRAAGPITGNEWIEQGVRLSRPGGGSLTLFQGNANHTPRSAPNSIFPSTASNDDRIALHFDPPQNVVGLWLIDAEIDGMGETVEFFGAAGLIVSIPMPILGSFSGGPIGNFFVGIDSPVPVTEVRVNDLGNDQNETTGVDDVWLGRGVVGNRYCSPAVANSTGQPARMQVLGRTRASRNDIELRATRLPANTIGFFLASQTQGSVPAVGGGQGTLCLGGSVTRFTALAASSGNSGQILRRIDLTRMPEPPTFMSTVQAGETWSFQCWFRDANPTLTSNLSDAIAVTFD